MQVGIPRAMSYYSYFPFWFGFFEDLGIEVVISDRTTKETMSRGSALVVSETCLPIKVYVGHILNLLDKGIDKIFVPSIQSIAYKIYNCSKIRGLPDLVRNVVKKDFTIIDATLDKSEKNGGLYAFLKECVKDFGITDEKRIKQASKAGWRVYNNFKIMLNSGLKFEDALRYAKKGQVVIAGSQKEYPINVAVLAHNYNIFDDRISMKIFDKLEKDLLASIDYFEEKRNRSLSGDANDYFFLSKDVARILLADVYMYRGKYGQAEGLLARVVENGFYSLDASDYSKPETINRLLEEGDGPETVFAVYTDHGTRSDVTVSLPPVVPVMTYTDVVLSYAECLYKNGKTSEAQLQVNEVKSAKGIQMTGSNVLEEIRDIRMRMLLYGVSNFTFIIKE